MSMINLSLKHGLTHDQARSHLGLAVDEARKVWGPMVQRADWSPDRDKVRLEGAGFWVEMWVDATDVHATGDIPVLGRLFSGPVASVLKQVLQKSFPKQLT